MTLHPYLRVEAAPEATVVKLATAQLGEAEIQSVGKKLFAVADRLGPSVLILDFAGVDFLTSTALGKLVALNKRVRAGGGRFVLANVKALVCEVFAVTCLDRVLDVRKGPGDEFTAPTSAPLAS